MRTLVIVFALTTPALADTLYETPRPAQRATAPRTVRLDVVRKHVTPPLKYSLSRRCPPDVPARLWLKQQLAKIDTVTFGGGDVVLNMSDGREVHADDVLTTQGFFHPTTAATFYVALYGRTAIAGVLVRDHGPVCGESWTIPVADEEADRG